MTNKMQSLRWPPEGHRLGEVCPGRNPITPPFIFGMALVSPFGASFLILRGEFFA